MSCHIMHNFPILSAANARKTLASVGCARAAVEQKNILPMHSSWLPHCDCIFLYLKSFCELCYEIPGKSNF